MTGTRTGLAMLGCALFLLAACETSPEARKGAETAVSKSRAGLGGAVLAPAEDLNLIKDEIPPRRAEMRSPYGPVMRRCSRIAEEVTALDEVLGYDPHESDSSDPSRSEAIGGEAADFTLDTIEDASTSFIPFRSLVRRATGASAYAKQVRTAYERGILRRAYLKGMGEALGCPPPASPQPLLPPVPSLKPSPAGRNGP